MWAPKRTPEAIVAELNAAVVNALASKGVGRRLTDLGRLLTTWAQPGRVQR
jgi:tripartite-type tricarboxylate transporter receptor subunit TctC